MLFLAGNWYERAAKGPAHMASEVTAKRIRCGLLDLMVSMPEPVSHAGSDTHS